MSLDAMQRIVKSYNKLIRQFYCGICKTTKKYYLIKDNTSKLKYCKCAVVTQIKLVCRYKGTIYNCIQSFSQRSLACILFILFTYVSPDCKTPSLSKLILQSSSAVGCSLLASVHCKFEVFISETKQIAFLLLINLYNHVDYH